MVVTVPPIRERLGIDQQKWYPALILVRVLSRSWTSLADVFLPYQFPIGTETNPRIRRRIIMRCTLDTLSCLMAPGEIIVVIWTVRRIKSDAHIYTLETTRLLSTSLVLTTRLGLLWVFLKVSNIIPAGNVAVGNHFRRNFEEFGHLITEYLRPWIWTPYKNPGSRSFSTLKFFIWAHDIWARWPALTANHAITRSSQGLTCKVVDRSCHWRSLSKLVVRLERFRRPSHRRDTFLSYPTPKYWGRTAPVKSPSPNLM